MRIVKLEATNVKRLKAVEITPEGDTVVIAGRNAQGKSSVLDSIWMALAGAAGAKETSRPIRDGEEKASVVLDLGDLVVTRKWTQAGTTLEVAAKDGARYPSPQTVLDGMLGKLSFDPLQFAEQAPREQVATLLSVVDLPFDPAEVAAKRAGVYERRTDTNRETKRLEAQVAGLAPAPDGTPDEESSATDLIAELQHATDLASEREHVATLYRQAVEEEARLAEAHRLAVEVVATLLARGTDLPEAIDPAPLQARLLTLDDTNTAVRRKLERAKLVEAHAASLALGEQLTAQLAEIDAEKTAAIASAKMPVEGLSFDEEGVLFNGVPFSQVSSAERLRVGLGMAMALNPQIRVIRITDGSLLDSENMALIGEMAGAHDFQVWIERVDETGAVGVTIEDGEVVQA